MEETGAQPSKHSLKAGSIVTEMVNIRISIAPDVLGLKTKTILLIASLHVALRCLGAKAIIHETKIFKWQSVLSIVL